jgi:glycosyltransferase involved in cell wall biosynthesis
MDKIKIYRLTTIPLTLNLLLKSQLKKLNNYFDLTIISSPGEDLKQVEEREGVRIIPLKMEREINLLRDIISLLNLIYIFFNGRPDIVHSNTPKSSLLSMLSGWLVGVKNRVYTVGGLRFEGAHGLIKFSLIFFEKLTCKLATHVLCESIGVKNKLIKIGVDTRKLILLNPSNLNGVDTDYFNPENFNSLELKVKHGYLENDFIFIFVGRIVKDKGIFELLEAFKLLSFKYNQVKLIIIGPNDGIKYDFEKFIELTNENKSVIYIPYLNDIRNYLAISNCMVLPSYREGFPNVILESGSMGKPVIMTNVNGHDEYLNSVSGLLIKIADKVDLNIKMEEMFLNHEKYDEVKIRSQVISNFSSEKVYISLENFYKSIFHND